MGFKKVSDKITPSMGRISRDIKTFPKEAYDFWVKITPIDTGNAKSKTRLVGNTIRADYNYAAVLDRGYSKQAPQGMSKPTDQFIKKLAKLKIRK
jgi:hypothetical protein